MIIVTGGAGFIGSMLLGELNEQGYSDILVVDHLGENEKWKNLRGRHFYDYLNKDEFLSLIYHEPDSYKGRIEAVFHLGACTSTTEKNADYLMGNNYSYSIGLAEWTMDQGIPFIYASSAATYGDGAHGFSDSNDSFNKLLPLNMYGFSKHLFDLWVRGKLLLPDHSPIAGFKFFNVFGPNEYHKEDMASVVYKAWNQINDSGSLSLFKSARQDYGDGEQKRDFVYVKDVCRVLIWAWKNKIKSDIYNLGSGKARSWNELAASVFSAMGKEQKIKYIDMPENLKGKYQYFTEADISKLRKAGYTEEFTSLEDAVTDYVKNYLQQ
ncbi:MAG: ADP-glyceromanno-heptose 6-epimerase [bacterium]|nr:ADP-glyceromanno-heptose 6-epimerase [bacterium]